MIASIPYSKSFVTPIYPPLKEGGLWNQSCASVHPSVSPFVAIPQKWCVGISLYCTSVVGLFNIVIVSIMSAELTFGHVVEHFTRYC